MRDKNKEMQKFKVHLSIKKHESLVLITISRFYRTKFLVLRFCGKYSNKYISSMIKYIVIGFVFVSFLYFVFKWKCQLDTEAI